MKHWCWQMINKIISVSLVMLILDACVTKQRLTIESTAPATMLETAAPENSPPPKYTPTSNLSPTTRIDLTVTPTREERPLDENGPWILLRDQDTESDSRKLVVTNLDGTGSIPIELSLDTWDIFDWLSPSSPTLPFVISKRTEPDYEITLDVYALPSGKRVREIPLVSQQAKEEILHYAESQEAIAFPIAPVIGSLTSGYQLAWSPNGRYLAYASAAGGPSADVYLLDLDDYRVRRLTSGPLQALILGWSPDSRWIVHLSAHWYRDGFTSTDSVWAVSVYGEIVRLYGEDIGGKQALIGWLSDTEFLVADIRFEDPFRNLRSVDISTGAITTWYKDAFCNVAIDHERHTLALVMGPYLGWRPEVEFGIYQLFQPGGALNPLLSGDFNSLEWHKELELFSVEETTDQGDSYLIFFDNVGEIMFKLSGEYLGVFPSPDGSYVLIRGYSESRLYSADWEQIDEFNSEGYLADIEWLKDSSGFCASYRPSCETDFCTIACYYQSENWQGSLVIEDTWRCPKVELVYALE